MRSKVRFPKPGDAGSRTGRAFVARIAATFTVPGLRTTFNDVTRRAKVDPLVIRSIAGHVTEDMREHNSTADLTEKRQAVAAVVRRLGFWSETLDQPLDRGADA